MFATFGILALIVLIYVRPQEFIESLASFPFLYPALILAVIGLAVDLGLRRSRLQLLPQVPWIIAFVVWCASTLITRDPRKFTSAMVPLLIAATLFFVIAYGIQSFRHFHILAALLLAIAIF